MIGRGPDRRESDIITRGTSQDTGASSRLDSRSSRGFDSFRPKMR